MMSHFKHAFRMAPLFVLLAVLCTARASALCVGGGTVTGDGLRLRAEAGTDSSILTSVPVGTKVVVLEKVNSGWYEVEYQGKTGFMSADYVDVSSKMDANLGYGEVKTEGDSLNVRSGPGTSHDRVTSLAKGAVVSITGVDSGWFKIDANGKTGYVSSDYIVTCEKSSSSSSGGSSKSVGTKIPYDTTGTIGNGQSTDAGLAIVACAEKYLGKPYVYGGNGPNSFDCSGFVKYVYKECGYSINRTASTQLSNGTSVAKSELQPGDIVFFRNSGDSHAASHVGIYVGGETFIHASSDTYQVEYSSLVTSNNAKKYIAARRIV